jgi:Shikimate kinase
MFQKKGEIFFRRQERALLEEIVATEDSCILSLGGGTPAYYNNMELINQNSESIFLRTSIKNLTERLLKQKHKRPLIANISDQDLPEFIAKHLFERNIFYNKAKYTVNTDDKTPEMIVEELCDLL